MSFLKTQPISTRPRQRDIDEAYGSRFLGAVDVGDRKMRTKLLRVKKEEVRDRDTGKMKKRILVFFENINKPLVLNTTTKDTLVSAFGKNPAGWVGATVGVYVDPDVMFGGKKVGGVRLRPLHPPAPAAKPVPKPVLAQPAKPATTAWPEQTAIRVQISTQVDFEPAA